MYPGYKRPRDVLDEYAITFYVLLNEGYRIKHKNYAMLARIASLPLMSKEDQNNFWRQLQYATAEPGAILNLDDEGSSMTDIKKFFGSGR